MLEQTALRCRWRLGAQSSSTAVLAESVTDSRFRVPPPDGTPERKQTRKSIADLVEAWLAAARSCCLTPMLLRFARRALSAQARSLSNVSATSSSASSSADNWLTVAATVVERVPVIRPDSPEWKKRFDDMQTNLNNRFAKPMPTFLRKRLDEKFSEPELVRFKKEFKPASRTTQADLDDDRQSLKRKLSQSLLLIVKDDNGEWVFPQGQWEEPESIRKVRDFFVSDVYVHSTFFLLTCTQYSDG